MGKGGGDLFRGIYCYSVGNRWEIGQGRIENGYTYGFQKEFDIDLS